MGTVAGHRCRPQRTRNSLGILGCDAKQSACRSLWDSSPLLPVTECGFADPDHHRELALRLSKPIANGLTSAGLKVTARRGDNFLRQLYANGVLQSTQSLQVFKSIPGLPMV